MDTIDPIINPIVPIIKPIVLESAKNQTNPQVINNNVDNSQPPSVQKPGEEKDIGHDLKDIELGSFEKEKLIEDFIFNNVSDLWRDIFNEKVTNSKKQKAGITGFFAIGKNKHMPLRGARLDLYVECESGNKYIVEIKNPHPGQYDTMNAIGKVLFYSTQFPEANKFVIVSSIYEQGFIETIKKFNLPIDFVLFTKDKAFLLKQ